MVPGAISAYQSGDIGGSPRPLQLRQVTCQSDGAAHQKIYGYATSPADVIM